MSLLRYSQLVHSCIKHLVQKGLWLEDYRQTQLQVQGKPGVYLSVGSTCLQHRGACSLTHMHTLMHQTQRHSPLINMTTEYDNVLFLKLNNNKCMHQTLCANKQKTNHGMRCTPWPLSDQISKSMLLYQFLYIHS